MTKLCTYYSKKIASFCGTSSPYALRGFAPWPRGGLPSPRPSGFAFPLPHSPTTSAATGPWRVECDRVNYMNRPIIKRGLKTNLFLYYEVLTSTAAALNYSLRLHSPAWPRVWPIAVLVYSTIRVVIDSHKALIINRPHTELLDPLIVRCIMHAVPVLRNSDAARRCPPIRFLILIY